MTTTAPSPSPARPSVAPGPPASSVQPSLLTLSPRQLRWTAIALAALIALVAVLGLVALAGRHSATTAAHQSAEPLMVDAQAIDTALSDADSTASGSFLGGRLAPEDLLQRYGADLGKASAALTDTTEQVGSDTQVTSALRTISMSLPVYAGLVQTATANQRQGYFPLAAAYMTEANSLMRTELLPAAQLAYGSERRLLTADQDNAVAEWLTVTTDLLLLVLVASLVLVQRRLSRQFRRTFNVPLVAATVVVVVVGAWFVVAVAVQGAAASRASAQGSTPVSTFTRARILALQMRADDELTLLSRDAVGTYQGDYRQTASQLGALLQQASGSADPTEEARLRDAQSALQGYRTAHAKIRTTDAQNNLLGAIQLASAAGPDNLPAASGNLDRALTTGITSSQQTFDAHMQSAADALLPLMILIVPLLAIAALLVLVGLQRRIDEYR